MRHVGAILCGGKSTRLPNKPLLPYLHGENKILRPLIHSSVDYLRRMGIDEVILLDQADSIIAPVLTTAYPEIAFYKVVDDFRGVPGALCQMAHSVQTENVMFVVLCCDNVYPEEFIKLTEEARAVVREVPKEDAVHLSRWHSPGSSPGQWITRDDPGYSLLALTTPWFLPRNMLQFVSQSFSDITQFFNEFQVPPLKKATSDWHDLGTEDTYLRYWANIHEQTLKDRQARGNPSAVEVLQSSVPLLHPTESKDQ